MTQPPYGQPPGPPNQPPNQPWPPAAVPPRPRPSRRRPSGWWLVAGAVLLLVGIAIGVVSLVTTLRGFTEVDAEVPADDQPHAVTVDTDRDRMLWAREGTSSDCTVVDTATGAAVTLRPVVASYTKSDGSGGWEGESVFDPGSGKLEVTCSSAGSDVEVGPAPQLGKFVGGLLLTVLVPLLVGGAGFVMLVVVGVLWLTGRPRQQPV